MSILSIDGGGYLGLASVAFLAEAEHHFSSRCSKQFDLFCGTSTGSIIALAFAKGMAAREVLELYRKLGPEIFPRPGFIARRVPKARGLFAARHDNAPLKEALASAFGDLTLGDLRERGSCVLVTAFSLTSGRPRIFKTDHAPNLTAHDGYLVRDVALASCAAPTYLPVVSLRDPVTGLTEAFCDGGVVANSPALLGFAEGVSHLGGDPSAVSVLSLATPRPALAEPPHAARENLKRGYLGWGVGEKIIKVAINGSSMLSDSALHRIAAATGATYCRVQFAEPTEFELDEVTEATTAKLQHMGAERARSNPTRADLAVFFSTGA